ncbi:hypothetical protein RI367_006934 [Sorochytrium milnesiophthora]
MSTPDAERANVEGCVFCAVNDRDFQLEYKDAEIAVFHDIAPSAHIHLLAIPLKHIRNVNNLQPADVDLVQRLGDTALAILKDKYSVDPNTVRLGFHNPPFTWVQHLHLHVVVEPIKPIWRWKFYTGLGNWLFVPLDSSVLARLTAPHRDMPVTAVPPKFSILGLEAEFKQQIATQPLGSETSESSRLRICFETLDVLARNMPSLGPLLKLICDEFDRAIYSEHLTVVTPATRQDAAIEVGLKAPPSRFDRIPWFVIVNRLQSMHVKDNLEATERMAELQQKLRMRERDITMLQKRVISIKQEVHGKDSEVESMQEQLHKRDMLVEQKRQEMEEAVRGVMVRLDAARRERDTLDVRAVVLLELFRADSLPLPQLALQQANANIERLSVYKVKGDSADANMLNTQTVEEQERHIHVDPMSLTEQSIREAEMLQRQLHEILNGKMDDLDISLHHHRKKMSLMNNLQRRTAGSAPDGASAPQVDKDLEAIMAEFQMSIDKIDQEQRRLADHISILRTTLAKQNETRDYIEWQKYAVNMQRKYAVQMYLSYDYGKTYRPFKQSPVCLQCGERVIICPHLNHYDLTVALPHTAADYRPITEATKPSGAPHMLVTHVQFRRPTLTVRVPPKRYPTDVVVASKGIRDAEGTTTAAAQEMAEAELEEFAETKFAQGSRFFRVIWQNYFNKRGGTRPHLPRSFGVDKLSRLINEIYDCRWEYEANSLQNTQRFLDYFYDFLSARYGLPHVSMRVAFELLSSLEFYQDSNTLVHMFVRHLAGSEDCAWKYVRIARRLFERFEPLDASRHRQIVRVMYPHRNETLYEQLELEQMGFSGSKYTADSLDGVTRIMARKRTEPNLRGFRHIVEKYDLTHRHFLSQDQWLECVGQILPDVPRDLAAQRYAIAEHDYGKNRVSLERLAQIVAYLFLYMLNEGEWGAAAQRNQRPQTGTAFSDLDARTSTGTASGDNEQQRQLQDKLLKQAAAASSMLLMHLKDELLASGYKLEVESDAADFRRVEQVLDMVREEIERARKLQELDRMKKEQMEKLQAENAALGYTNTDASATTATAAETAQ